jgi:hypothetical protein
MSLEIGLTAVGNMLIIRPNRCRHPSCARVDELAQCAVGQSHRSITPGVGG